MGPCERLQGERPRPRLAGAAGRVPQRQQLIELISSAEPITLILTAEPITLILSAERHELGHAASASAQLVVVSLGADPQPGSLDGPSLTAWREAVALGHRRQYGQAADGREHAAATMVLSWALEALAQPLLHTAAAAGVALSPGPGEPGLRAATTVSVHPQGLYPTRIDLAWSQATSPARPGEALTQVEPCYREAAQALARGYEAGVRMSSRQRLGLVDDIWQAQLARALRAGPLTRRRACCMIVALPGLSPCAGCPRITRPSGAR